MQWANSFAPHARANLPTYRHQYSKRHNFNHSKLVLQRKFIAE